MTLADLLEGTLISLKNIWDRVIQIKDRIGTFTDSTETVAHKLENIEFDKSDLSKTGSNPNATNTEILDLILALTSSYVISPVTQAEIDAIVQRIINQN